MVLVAYESPDLLEKLAQNLAMGMVDLDIGQIALL